MQEEESKPAEPQEVVDVVTTSKIITEVVTAITAASTTITAADVLIPTATTAAAPILIAVPSRRRKGVVIRDPEENTTTSTIIHSEAKSKDKGKGILVEEPKPLKKQAQIKQDEKYARELEAELNKNINWYEVIDHVKRKQKEDNEQMDEEDSRALKRLNESQEEKAAKKQKLDEDVKELKRHLQIVPNDEDDVYTKATPLAHKVPVVDYEIYNENNKPYYKIKRADARYTCSNLEKSKKCSWSSKSQELEDVGILWCTDHYIYNNIIDFAGRKEISTHKLVGEVGASWRSLITWLVIRWVKIERKGDHDTSQDPIVNLEGAGGSEQDQAKLPHDSPFLGFLFWRLSRMLKEILTLMARIKMLEKRWEENAKSGPTNYDSAELNAELDEDMEYIDTKEAMNKGRQSTVDTARPDDDTARPDVSTARQEFSTTGVLEEPESAKKMTKSDFDAAQIARDEEIDRQLEVELQAEVEREIQREEQASMDYIANLYDEVQARIDANHELANTVKGERSKPPTKTQLRRLMMTYLKNMDFVPIGSEEDERRIRDMNKKAKEESNDKEDGTEIHRLAERRYPLTTKTLERMLSLSLIAESSSDAAYDLLRFIQKQIDESGGYDRGEKDI
nr:hypothetical protein [Tanacetum cinerariifolium]